MTHTKVQLIGITYPKLDKVNTAEELVAYVARVSNPSNQYNMDTSAKLVKYLIKNQHWSPFELVNLVLEIETTRDIARQILRHRSFSFQEFSQRYADPVLDLAIVNREARYQDKKNRQASTELDLTIDKDRQIAYQWENMQTLIINSARNAYNWALEKGIAKEQARAVLPEGMTMSRMYMNGTLRSWIHYVQLRAANGTQKEHRQVADLCLEILKQEFPNIMAAVDEVTQ